MIVPIATLLLVFIHQGQTTQNVDKLLKKHPTWSFKVESVDAFIKNTLHSMKGSKFHVSEHALRSKIEATIGPNEKHIIFKTGDPKYVDIEKLPSNFDAREHWPACADLIGQVEDEGHCHTDSPAVVASVMADRQCIFTNGKFKESLSQYVLSSAEACTRNPNIRNSWNYSTEVGIPTGGPYGSKKGCYPNYDSPCIHNNDSYHLSESLGKGLKPCTEELYYDRDSPKKCSNPNYSTPLEKDRKKLTTWYPTSREEFSIRNEILAYGPVVTSIILFDDFFEKPKGIYWKKDGAKFLAWDKYFKLIGWGEEKGVKYWLAVNTWDTWGDKVFKIPRGINYWFVEFILTCGVYEDID